jgi:hypothetical protein
MQANFDAGAQHLAPPRVLRERIQASQRIWMGSPIAAIGSGSRRHRNATA